MGSGAKPSKMHPEVMDLEQSQLAGEGRRRLGGQWNLELALGLSLDTPVHQHGMQPHIPGERLLHPAPWRLSRRRGHQLQPHQ